MLAALLPAAAAAQTLRTVGPFDVTFYGSGESDSGATGAFDWTPQQMDDIAAALISWSNGIANTSGRQIKLHLFWNSLGSERPRPDDQPARRKRHDQLDQHRSACGATARRPAPPTIARIQFGTGVSSWSFGAAAATSGYDFRSVSGHELGHTLGFVSTYDPGSDTFSSQGLSAWDKKLVDSLGNSPAVNSTGTPGNFNQTRQSGLLHRRQRRRRRTAATCPSMHPIPTTADRACRIVDESALPNALMSPQFAAGQSIRTPTALEWEIMQDLGWSIIGTKTWSKGAGTLNWTDAGNWNASGVPDAGWNVKFTGAGLTDGDTLLLTGSQAMHTLSIDSTRTFTVGGSGSLEIAGGNIVRTATSAGTQTIAVPVTLGADATWDIANSATTAGRLVFANTLSSAGSVTKISPGEVVLAGTATLGDVVLNDGEITLAAGGLLLADTFTGRDDDELRRGAELRRRLAHADRLGQLLLPRRARGQVGRRRLHAARRKDAHHPSLPDHRPRKHGGGDVRQRKRHAWWRTPTSSSASSQAPTDYTGNRRAQRPAVRCHRPPWPTPRFWADSPTRRKAASARWNCRAARTTRSTCKSATRGRARSRKPAAP